MKKLVFLLGLLIVTAPLWFQLALNTILLAVDRTEFAYVTEFGRHVATYDGANDTESGLHWRWPWPVQSVQRIDRRLQYLDLPGSELLTHDPKRNTIDRTLTIVSYACWRITNENGGVDQFVRRVGTPEQAKTLLRQRISSRLGAVIGQMEMEDLISTDRGKVEASMKKLRQHLLDGLQLQAKQDYGIELVDLRLRRHSYPQAVRQAIFDRIISERNKKVADYQSEGNQLAANIKSEAERDSRYILTEARAREQELKGQADADADRIRNAAHSKDVEFYAFLKKLEEYQRILGDNKTVLLLSSHRDLFDLLFNPPQGRNGPQIPNPVAGQVPPKPASTLGGPQ
jgi:modulator of FtsH protease HflC